MLFVKISHLFANNNRTKNTYTYDTEEVRKQTTLLNRIAIFTLAIIGVYMSMHLFLGSGWVALAFDCLYIFTALLILFFQSRKHYTLAYYTTGIGYTIAFACSSILIGPQNQVEYLIFVSTLGTAMLFDDVWTKRIFFVFGFVIFILLKIFHIINPHGLLHLEFSPVFNILNGMVVFGIIYFIVDRALENSKKSLGALQAKNREVSQLNITLEQKVEERTQEIQRKSKALEQSNAELKRFSYIAAHDLREPLRNIIGFSKLMNKDIVKHKYNKIGEYSGYIDWAARRIDTITRDIVDYTELEDKVTEISMVNFSDLVEKVIIEQKVKRKDIIFNTIALPTIEINEALAAMLFTQLIENAIQYCDKPQPIITIQYVDNQHFHQFSIMDNGVGIAPEFHEKIFIMFKRLHNDIQKNGSGIGLSISKKIVESYGGKIWLNSECGKGSTFHFTIPK